MRVASVLAILAALSVLTGCLSPGKPYAYLDVKFSAGPVATPVQPAVNQATTVTFTIRNTFNLDLANVDWTISQTSGPAVTTAPAAAVINTIPSIAAFGSVDESFAFTPTVAGTYVFNVTLDPNNTIAERDEGNNVGTVSIVVADHDLSFGLPSPSIVDSVTPATPKSTNPLTLTFAVADTLNPGHTGATTVTVNYQVAVNGNPVALGSPTPASGFTLDAAGTNPQLVTATLPATGSAGSFVFTITLSTTPAEAESTTVNNTATVIYTVAAGN